MILLVAAALAGCEREAPKASIPVKPETFDQRWQKADADRDGKLSRVEAAAGYTPGMQANFDAIDANKDGFVTRAEREAFREKTGKK
jgi:hypothetical protein